GLRTKDGERAVLKAPLPRCSSVPFASALCITRRGCCSVLLDLKISMRPDDFRGARTLARRVETRLDACRSLRGRQASTRVSRRQARVPAPPYSLQLLQNPVSRLGDAAGA